MHAPSADPTVSTIIIFLNEERFLREAIESVLQQSYRNWELLLVDDGSTDGSEAIARDYASRMPAQVRYLTHPDRANCGMSASRNLGVKHASGTLVAFLDGDDVWVPHKLARQVELFQEFPDAVMVCGATRYWHAWDRSEGPERDRVVETGFVGTSLTLPQNCLYHPPELMKRLYPLGQGASPSASGYMITRSLYERVGGFENSFRGLFEDQVFRIKAYLHGPIYVSDDCFDWYRQHRNSCVHVAAATGQNVAARRAFLRWLRTYLLKVSCRDPRIWILVAWAHVRLKSPRVHRIGNKVARIVARLRTAN